MFEQQHPHVPTSGRVDGHMSDYRSIISKTAMIIRRAQACASWTRPSWHSLDERYHHLESPFDAHACPSIVHQRISFGVINVIKYAMRMV
ncbi:hypothetical protein RSAG8_10239, partial [Rhizoctonia solani AG-8 WAC10335]